MLIKTRNNRNSHSLLVGIQSGIATLEDSVVISYENKHTHTIWSSNHASRYFPKWTENLHPYKTLYLGSLQQLYS